jgi:hypothetical protein
MAGDWNETLHSSDRSTGTCYPADRAHRSFVTITSLKPAATPQRAHTYTQTQFDLDTHHSRIDDVLLAAQTSAAANKEGTVFEQVYECGGNFDHKPLCTFIPLAGIRLLPAPAARVVTEQAPSTWSRIQLPIQKESKTRAHMEMEATLTSEMTHLLGALRPACEAITEAAEQLERAAGKDEARALLTALRNHNSVKTTDVTTLSQEVGVLLHRCLGILESHCQQKPPCTGKLHARRGIGKRLARLHDEHKAMKDGLSQEMRNAPHARRTPPENTHPHTPEVRR